ncbi:MAG: hypothetical protein H0W72_07400 [Planctomycetes bacterium]|nr:hypothetical protein [Planctomycetota bacterium]
MPRPVVVISDAASAAAFSVAKELLARGCVVDVLSGGIPALGAIAARRNAGSPVQLVVANATMPDINPAIFLDHLAKGQSAVPVVFYADLDLLPPATAEAIRDKGGSIVAWPFDAARCDALAAAASSGNVTGLEGPGGGGAAVLHGTAQFAAMDKYLRTPLPGSLVDPAHGSTQRRTRNPAPGMPVDPSQSVTQRMQPPPAPDTSALPPAARPVMPGTNTGFRRDPPPASPPASSADPSQPTVTNRIARRSVGGPPADVAPQTGSKKLVKCPRCGNVTSADLRSLVYTVRCAGCGGNVVVLPG